MSTSPTIPQQPGLSLPPQMRAGDTFAWSVQTRRLQAGSAVSYYLSAVIKNAAVRIIAGPSAVDDNGVAAFSIAGTVTTTWKPGRYQWVCFAFDHAGERTELAQGEIRIEPDPAGAVPVDPRSDNMRLLVNIRNLLQGKSMEDAAMYKIGTRELTKMPVKDLIYWEAIIEARVRRERIRRGERVPSKTIGIAFGDRG